MFVQKKHKFHSIRVNTAGSKEGDFEFWQSEKWDISILVYKFLFVHFLWRLFLIKINSNNINM